MKYIQSFNINFIDYHENLPYFEKIKVGRYYFKYPDYVKNLTRYENIFKNKKLHLDINAKSILCNMIITYCDLYKIQIYPEGENFFIKYASNNWCVFYAKKIIKSRWLKAEHKIFSKVRSTYDYVYFFKIPRDSKIIKKISESSLYSYKYCKNIIKDRVKELEDSILKSNNASFLYFKNVLKKNWDNNQDIKSKFEKAIVNNFSYVRKYMEITYKRKFNKIYEDDFYVILERDFIIIYDKYKNDHRLKILFHFKKK